MRLGIGARWDGKGCLCAAGEGSGVRNMGGWMRGLKGTAVAWDDWETVAGLEAKRVDSEV